MSEENIVYIVTRLFDFAEKLKAESLERAVLAGIQIAHQASIERASALSTFVPFRDTSQDTLQGINQARFIYEADLARLENLFALVGYFDGVSKDEGISMEIGYAYARSTPILLITTDFLVYRLKHNPSIRSYYDPVLERMTGHLLRRCKLPYADNFEQRLRAAISSLHEEVTNTIVELIRQPSVFVSPRPIHVSKPTQRPLVLLEFGGGLFEWQQMLASRLQDLLKQKAICDVVVSRRYLSDSTTAYQAGEEDITSALMADLFVICADSEEMNAGSAALVGFGKALNKPVVLFDSKATLSYAEGAQEMSRNLMVDGAATRIVASLEDIPDIVEGLLSEKR